MRSASVWAADESPHCSWYLIRGAGALEQLREFLDPYDHYAAHHPVYVGDLWWLAPSRVENLSRCLSSIVLEGIEQLLLLELDVHAALGSVVLRAFRSGTLITQEHLSGSTRDKLVLRSLHEVLDLPHGKYPKTGQRYTMKLPPEVTKVLSSLGISYRGVDPSSALGEVNSRRIDGGREAHAVGLRQIQRRWVWEETEDGALGVWDRDQPAEPIVRYPNSGRQEAKADVQSRAWGDVRDTPLGGHRWWVQRWTQQPQGHSGRVLLHHLPLPAVAHITIEDRLTRSLSTHGVLPPGISPEERREHVLRYGSYQGLECSIDDVEGAKQAAEWAWSGHYELGSWRPVPETVPRTLEATLTWIAGA